MKFKEAVTYDDMLIVPQYSDITSRSEVDISNRLGHRDLRLPIIASPMDTVSEEEMAIAMYRSGGMAVLHRYNTIAEQASMAKNVTQVSNWSGQVGAAIGVTHKKFKKWHSTFWDNLETSIRLHKIRKLIVINHEDCGAAKIANKEKKFNSSIESKIHKESFKNIKKVLNKKYPNLKVGFKILSV